MAETQAVPMVAALDMPLVPDRTCGACDACCIQLVIDDPLLKKRNGVRCRHLTAGSGCGIYDQRPRTCQAYFCGWRLLPWVREPLRPDRSGVLFMLRRRPSPFAHSEGEVETSLMVMLLSVRAVEAEGLPETIAAAIAAGIRVFVGIPGPPGMTGAEVEVTMALYEAVRTRDKPAVLAVLRECWTGGRRGKREKIKLGRPRPSAGR